MQLIGTACHISGCVESLCHLEALSVPKRFAGSGVQGSVSGEAQRRLDPDLQTAELRSQGLGAEP